MQVSFAWSPVAPRRLPDGLGAVAEPTAAAGYARALLEFAVASGADEARLLGLSGIGAHDLEDQDARVPMARYSALMRAAVAITGNRAFALEYGAETDFRQFSIVGLIAHASATMADALFQMNRYGRLVMELDGLRDGPRFENLERDGGLWLEDRRVDPNAFPELTESTFSRFICGSRKNFPQAVFALEAHVTHDAPSHAAAYERVWEIPVTFGSDRNAIRMNPAWPSLRIGPENRYVFGILCDRADTLLGELETSKTVRGRVEGALLPLLHTGDVSMERVSQNLGMSRQTLFRKLKAEGATYEQVADDLRRKMAMHYLTGRKASINETAYLVGFSDPASFSRAFKRWTGVPPREARARAAAEASHLRTGL